MYRCPTCGGAGRIWARWNGSASACRRSAKKPWSTSPPSNNDRQGESMKRAKILTAAAAFAAAGSVHAAGVGLRTGTTGVGADLGWNLAPTLNARVGYSAFSYGTHLNSGDVRYDSKLKLSNLSGLLDWHVGGPFRITAGVI